MPEAVGFDEWMKARLGGPRARPEQEPTDEAVGFDKWMASVLPEKPPPVDRPLEKKKKTETPAEFVRRLRKVQRAESRAEVEALTGQPLPSAEEYIAGLRGEERIQEREIAEERERKRITPARGLELTFGAPGRLVSGLAKIPVDVTRYYAGEGSIPHRVAQTGEAFVGAASYIVPGLGTIQLAGNSIEMFGKAIAGEEGALEGAAIQTALIGTLKGLGTKYVKKRLGPVAPLLQMAATSALGTKAGVDAARAEYERTGDWGEAIEAGIAIGGGTLAGFGLAPKLGRKIMEPSKVQRTRRGKVYMREKAAGERRIEVRQKRAAKVTQERAQKRVKALEAAERVSKRGPKEVSKLKAEEAKLKKQIVGVRREARDVERAAIEGRERFGKAAERGRERAREQVVRRRKRVGEVREAGREFQEEIIRKPGELPRRRARKPRPLAAAEKRYKADIRASRAERAEADIQKKLDVVTKRRLRVEKGIEQARAGLAKAELSPQRRARMARIKAKSTPKAPKIGPAKKSVTPVKVPPTPVAPAKPTVQFTTKAGPQTKTFATVAAAQKFAKQAKGVGYKDVIITKAPVKISPLKEPPVGHRETPTQVAEYFRANPSRVGYTDIETGKIYQNPAKGKGFKPLAQAKTKADVILKTREGFTLHEAGEKTWEGMSKSLRKPWEAAYGANARERFSDGYSIAKVSKLKNAPKLLTDPSKKPLDEADYFRRHAAELDKISPETKITVTKLVTPTGAPALPKAKPITWKQTKAIHAAKGKMPDDEYRALLSEVSGGKTTSKEFTTAEASRALTALKARATELGKLKKVKRLEIAKSAPAEVKEAVTRRQPSAQEIAAENEMKESTAREVVARRGAKYPGKVGDITPPGLWRRFKESRVGQVMGLKNLGPETTVAQAVGDKGKGYKALFEDRMLGEANSHAYRNATNDRFAQNSAKFRVTFKDFQGWIGKHGPRGRRSIGKAKPVALKLPSGPTVKVTPNLYAVISGTAYMPRGAKALAEQGIWIGQGIVKFKAPDIQAVRSLLQTSFPKLAAEVQYLLSEYNGPHKQAFAETYFRDTGKQLDLQEVYWPIERYRPGIRREVVERAGAAGQLEQWAQETARSMSRQVRAEAMATAKASRLEVKTLPKGERAAARKAISATLQAELGRAKSLRPGKAPKAGMALTEQGMARPPGELRGMAPLKEWVGSKAPLELRGLFEQYFSHVNRVSAYYGKALPAKNADLVLWHPAFRKAMQEGFADGNARLTELERLSQEYKGLEVTSGGALDSLVSGVLRRATVGALGLKAQIPLYQGLSYLNAAAVIPTKHLFGKGLLTNPKRTMAEIREYGPAFRSRFEGSAHMIMSPSLRTAQKESLRRFIGGKKGIIERVALGPIHAVDTLTMMKLWDASRGWAKADGFSGKKLLIETNRRAMIVAARTQPTWDTMSISPLQREARKSPWKKPFVMFTSQANKNINQALRAYDSWQHKEISTAKFTRDAGIPLVVNAMGVYFIGLGVKAGTHAAWGEKMRERSITKHVADVLDRSFGGWLYFGKIGPELIRRVNAKMGGRARYYNRSNMLLTVANDSWKLVDIAAELLTEKAGLAGKKPPKDLEKQFLQALRSVSTVGGVPTAGIEQALRPGLQPPKPPRRRTRRRRR